jgi:long-chain acyl-CoA synthetase
MSGRISAPNLASLFREAGDRWGDKPAFATRQSDGSFRSVTYRAWRDRALDLAESLIALGVGACHHVAILSDNRFEWILADAAILFCGAADVPRAADITPAEITYILGHADVGVVFVENAAVLAKVEPLLPGLPGIRHLIVMDPAWSGSQGKTPAAEDNRIPRLVDLEERGERLRNGGSRLAEERIGGVRPNDLFTIIYTSGTTGTPKGVQLTHAAMASQVRNLPFDLSPADRSLSILPIWHSFERVFEVISIAAGIETCYTTLRYLGEDLKTVRPTIMASAPRLWEGLYQRVMSGVQKAPPLRRGLFRVARSTADAVRRAHSFFTGQELDLTGRSIICKALFALRHALIWGLLILPSLILDRIVLSKLRAAVGGRLRGTISGGGALPPHVDAFFNDIGIPVLEGYGLTESCPVLAVRTWEQLVIGTVGPAFPETEIRIVDPSCGQILYPEPSRRDLGRGLRGEIHAKGPQIMKGYYKDPEATARVLRDGWLATGDLGVMTFNDCLKIVGRCKETIVLLGGENVEPLPIESKLLESPLIEQCMVVGQDQKHLGVLVVPSVGGFAAVEVVVSDSAALVERLEARELIQAEIRRLICAEAGFKSFERLAALELIGKPFEVGDELTMTFKLRRHVITERYADRIEEMFH